MIEDRWYMQRVILQALNPLSNRVTFIAIIPGMYPGKAKMCLRLSWGSQMPPPAKRVKATTYRHDYPEVTQLWLRLLFMQLTRDLFAIAKYLFFYGKGIFLLKFVLIAFVVTK